MSSRRNSGVLRSGGRNHHGSRKTINLTQLITLVVFSATSFYCGTLVGWNAAGSSSASTTSSYRQTNCEDVCSKMVAEKCNTPDNNNTPVAAGSSKRFSRKLSHWANGLISVNRKDMFDTYDFGVPMNHPNAENEDILMLYNEHRALPTDRSLSRLAEYNGDIPQTSAKVATENCDTMSVVFIKNPDPRNNRQCIALVGGQYQGYHVQRYQRLIGEGAQGKTDSSAPLRLTSRMTNGAGYDEFILPKPNHLKMHQEILRTYFHNLNKIRDELDAILKKIAVNNSVVVMTVNKGQSELLINFVCSARARGFNLDNVIVFPTDKFSKDISDGLGLASYYSRELMSHVPQKEAARYGDSTFGSIMMAKVLCVHLVNDLGYDILFQDVDIIWYRNPFEYFNSDAHSDFDVYFQDDGNRQTRFAPYSANSGFYFVRSNDRSKMLFRSLMYAGDVIFSCRSHQQILIQFLAEHNSLSGLKVKVLSRENDEFPSGYHYNMRKDFMKKLTKGETNSYIFHMCWTLNKEDKLAYMRQMGMWYLKDECIGKEASSLEDINTLCCAREPIIKCFYRDKASIIPCKDSPPKDKGQRGLSFW